MRNFSMIFTEAAKRGLRLEFLRQEGPTLFEARFQGGPVCASVDPRLALDQALELALQVFNPRTAHQHREEAEARCLFD